MPVGKVIFRLKLANNGEVLVGVLFQGQNVEDKMIPWEVERNFNPVTTGFSGFLPEMKMAEISEIENRHNTPTLKLRKQFQMKI